jgi:hypothetical protein
LFADNELALGKSCLGTLRYLALRAFPLQAG